VLCEAVIVNYCALSKHIVNRSCSVEALIVNYCALSKHIVNRSCSVEALEREPELLEAEVQIKGINSRRRLR
jgi:hypothetical protein